MVSLQTKSIQIYPEIKWKLIKYYQSLCNDVCTPLCVLSIRFFGKFTQKVIYTQFVATNVHIYKIVRVYKSSAWWPSSHPLSVPMTYNICQGRGRSWSQFQLRGRVHQSISGLMHRQTTSHTHVHTYGQLRIGGWPNLMSLECGRKLEYPVKTHASMVRTCKLQTGRPQLTKGSTWNLLALESTFNMAVLINVSRLNDML